MSNRKNNGKPITNHSNLPNDIDKKSKEFIPERIYIDRDSLLTEMLKISHFSSLMNMFFSFVILMLLNTIFVDWLHKGLFQHYHHIIWVKREFGQPMIAFLTILGLYLIAVFVYLLLDIWFKLRQRIVKFIFIIDITSLFLYLLLIVCLMVVPVLVVMKYYIPPCTSIFIVYEQIRLFMKLHAFIRTLLPRYYNFPREFNKNEKQSITSWKSFLYFMIIPTLIYRDSYPMRKSIDFKFVISSFMQFILCIIFMYYVFINLMRPIFIDFNPTFMTLEILIPKLFQTILPTVLMMLTLFFCFLHLWLNTFAELTKFGDRQFYKDWWNATSLSDYFRTWNALIYDWLYTYIYRDFSLLIFKITNHKSLSKSFGMISVLSISALVHEYVLAYCFRFFYPILLTVFFFSGCILYFIKANRSSRIPNIMLWTGLYLGNSIFVTLYSCEWYARRNCIRKIDGYLDFIIPRSLFCELSKNITI